MLHELCFAVYERNNASGAIFSKYILLLEVDILGGSYRRSINVHNPLGSKGALVNAFADLIKHLWGDQYTHISPVSLRVMHAFHAH